jgi:CDP-glycerol glycerophosphotransferase (TagB/SpsB family)
MKSNGNNTAKLKVVFMTTRPHYRIHVEKTLRTFDILSSLDDVQVVVKPHTRTGKEAEMYEGLSLANVSDISSVELAEWADIMLVVGSSIIIEALTRNKPALYLKYLHENTTEYEEFGACWIIHDEDELRDALLSLRDQKGHVPYTDENVDRWLAEVIYGGQNERDVLRVYEEFIVNCAAS